MPRPVALMGVALLSVGLMLNPILLFPHAEDAAFEYRAAEVPAEDAPGLLPSNASRGPVDGLNCRWLDHNWGCLFDVFLSANGTQQFPVSETIFEREVADDRQYVYIDGQYHRREAEVENGTVTAELVPVTQAELLAGASVSRDALSEREQRVLDQGKLTTYRPIELYGSASWDGGLLVSDNGTYYVLWQESADTEPPTFVEGLTFIPRLLAFAVGLVGFAGVVWSVAQSVE